MFVFILNFLANIAIHPPVVFMNIILTIFYILIIISNLVNTTRCNIIKTEITNTVSKLILRIAK